MYGSGNSFNVATTKGSYSLTIANDYSGAISPITAKSTLDTFNFTGGDVTGTAAGSDFIAVVYGQRYQGLNNTVSYASPNGSYELQFNTNFIGQFDPIQIRSTARTEFLGTANGSDAEASLNGKHFVAQGNSFQFEGDDVSLTFDAVAGFVGNIDALTIAEQTETVTNYITRIVLNPVYKYVNSQVSGTSNEQEVDPLDSIMQEIEELAALSNTIQVLPKAELTAASEQADDPLTQSKIVSRLFTSMSQNTLLTANPTTQKFLKTNLTSFKIALDIEV